MKRSSLLVALAALSLAACGQKAETPATQADAPQAPIASPAATAALPTGHPEVDPSRMVQPAPLPSLTQKGKVLSTENVAQYTYIEVRQDNRTRWLATTTSAAKKGDTILFDDGTEMVNFTSKVLNRTFPSITFVGRVIVDNGQS